jgi:hypothetical protein
MPSLTSQRPPAGLFKLEGLSRQMFSRPSIKHVLPAVATDAAAPSSSDVIPKLPKDALVLTSADEVRKKTARAVQSFCFNSSLASTRVFLHWTQCYRQLVYVF